MWTLQYYRYWTTCVLILVWYSVLILKKTLRTICLQIFCQVTDSGTFLQGSMPLNIFCHWCAVSSMYISPLLFYHKKSVMLNILDHRPQESSNHRVHKLYTWTLSTGEGLHKELNEGSPECISATDVQVSHSVYLFIVNTVISSCHRVINVKEPSSTRPESMTITLHFLSYTIFQKSLAVDFMGPCVMMKALWRL